MAKSNLNDLQAFVAVARVSSFTRAAAQLGVTQSALSQAIAGLEGRLGVRLLARTTRAVSPTAAGERLFQHVSHRLDELEEELVALTQLRDKPAGTVRITCGDFVLKTILLPRLTPLLAEYPDLKLEFDVNYGFRDIVADRFDAGVRFGETIDKDMIAMPIGPETRMAAVASPSYFRRHGAPKKPRELTGHRCINLRFPTHGGVDVWEFERRAERLRIRVEGPLIFNNTTHVADAALSGAGIAYLPQEEFAPYLERGDLVRVLEDWCPSFAGYHLYYPSRRQPSPVFSLVLDRLRLHTSTDAAPKRKKQQPAAR